MNYIIAILITLFVLILFIIPIICGNISISDLWYKIYRKVGRDE